MVDLPTFGCIHGKCSEIYHTDAEWGLHSALKQDVRKQAVSSRGLQPTDPNL